MTDRSAKRLRRCPWCLWVTVACIIPQTVTLGGEVLYKDGHSLEERNITAVRLLTLVVGAAVVSDLVRIYLLGLLEA